MGVGKWQAKLESVFYQTGNDLDMVSVMEKVYAAGERKLLYFCFLI
jgi:hypothetical protein